MSSGYLKCPERCDFWKQKSLVQWPTTGSQAHRGLTYHTSSYKVLERVLEVQGCMRTTKPGEYVLLFLIVASYPSVLKSVTVFTSSFIWKGKREYMCAWRALPSIGSFPKYPQLPVLPQAESRRAEPSPGLCCGWQEPAPTSVHSAHFQEVRIGSISGTQVQALRRDGIILCSSWLQLLP